MKCNRILIYELKRELLIYLLKDDFRKKRNILLIEKSIYERDKEIIEKLGMLKIIIKKKIIFKGSRVINKILNNIIFLKNFSRIKKLIIKKQLSIFAINDLGIMRKYTKGLKVNIIEDGIVDYVPYIKKNKNIKEQIIKVIDFCFGIRERKSMFSSLGFIDNIYLTGLTKIPTEIKSKVKIVKLNILWDNKTEAQKKEILHIFGVDKNIYKQIDEIKVLLITQPLSEDRIINEEEKIEIYRQILSKYKEEDVIIKPHPREKTDYLKYFPKSKILEREILLELLILNGLKVRRVITLFSTAVFNLGHETKIDFYGTEVHPNILKRFGSMDHIMKRNKFL